MSNPRITVQQRHPKIKGRSGKFEIESDESGVSTLKEIQDMRGFNPYSRGKSFRLTLDEIDLLIPLLQAYRLKYEKTQSK